MHIGKLLVGSFPGPLKAEITLPNKYKFLYN